MHIDNSACNLASINLLKYLDDDGTFDVEGYKHTVEVMFTAQEILVGNADYPTEKIAENSRKFRQLGLGYANLGALLMAQGMPYDSDGGRAWAAALTALMTGHAYATSARTAGRMGPFAGYAENADAMNNVLRMHRAEAAKIDEDLVPHGAARRRAAVVGRSRRARRDVRRAQLAGHRARAHRVPRRRHAGADRAWPCASRIAGRPDRRPVAAARHHVQTDEGPREATQFYVNGVEPVVNVESKRGYRIRGTAKHRIKVVDETGEWVWRRLADVQPGDRVPLSLHQLVGTPQEVVLPPLAGGALDGRVAHVRVPRTMTAELAEFVGYFMGDGSLHSKGLRLCVGGRRLRRRRAPEPAR